jgi:phage virion morphogenesis protein
MTNPITIEVDSRSIMDALAQLIHQGQNMHPVMDAIGQRLEERISSRFETKTDPNGATWAQWKPSTIKSYPKDGNKTLLDRTGDMLKGIGHHADADSVTVGFDKPYAYFHEHGTSKMPRRGMVFGNVEARTLGADDEASILELLHSFFAESI